MPDDAAQNGGDANEAESTQTGGLYDLAQVPEDLRPHVEPHLKAIEGSVTKKLQENAEKLKAWEPYDELGLSEIQPEALQQLLDFAELAQDETRFADWWKETGERMGLFPEETEGDDDLLGLGEELTPDKVKELIAEAVSENMKPVNETLQQQQTERAEQEAMAEVQKELAALKEEHGDDLDVDAIVNLAYAYADDDPDSAIAKGFAEYQRIVGKGARLVYSRRRRSSRRPRRVPAAPPMLPSRSPRSPTPPPQPRSA